MTSAKTFIPALLPRGKGHQFLLYGDACSGVPGALHEKTFASVNAVVQRLRPQPDFILFPGDEIIGLTPDADALRASALAQHAQHIPRTLPWSIELNVCWNLTVSVHFPK